MTDEPNCEEASRLISAGLDRELAARDRVRLRYHLVFCSTCRLVEEQMRLLSVAMKRLDGGLLPRA